MATFKEIYQNFKVSQENFQYVLLEIMILLFSKTWFFFRVTENVEIRKDTDASASDYVQLLDPLASSAT